jgi:pimeloyl-ACP methyl ester carboxylesterase
MSNHVVKVGRGPHKVLALHGWFGCAQGWGALVDALDTERFTWAFMDARGYGGSRELAGSYTLEEIAGDALAAADRLAWPRFSVVGHSMGGAAAQHVLAAAPERLQALVGITPVPAGGVPFDEGAWSLFSAAAGSAEARRTIIDFSTGGRLSPHWVAQQVERSRDHAREDAFAAYLPAWARTDITERIRGLALPVQVIAGEHDGGLNEAFLRDTWLRHYPNAVLEVMRNAGHYPMDETPVALATAIEAFLLAATR